MKSSGDWRYGLLGVVCVISFGVFGACCCLGLPMTPAGWIDRSAVERAPTDPETQQSPGVPPPSQFERIARGEETDGAATLARLFTGSVTLPPRVMRRSVVPVKWWFRVSTPWGWNGAATLRVRFEIAPTPGTTPPAQLKWTPLAEVGPLLHAGDDSGSPFGASGEFEVSSSLAGTDTFGQATMRLRALVTLCATAASGEPLPGVQGATATIQFLDGQLAVVE